MYLQIVLAFFSYGLQELHVYEFDVVRNLELALK